MGSTTYIITSERFNPLTDYRLYTTHFEHFNFVHSPQAIKLVAFIMSKICWIISLSQQSPATHSVSGKTDSWIIRAAGIPGSDDICPERGLHTTLGFSMNIGYGKIVAKANRDLRG